MFWRFFKILNRKVLDLKGVVAQLVGISFEAELKVYISCTEIESCGFFLECAFVALVLKHNDLLVSFLTCYPHSDLCVVSLVGPYHQMDVVAFV